MKGKYDVGTVIKFYIKHFRFNCKNIKYRAIKAYKNITKSIEFECWSKDLYYGISVPPDEFFVDPENEVEYPTVYGKPCSLTGRIHHIANLVKFQRTPKSKIKLVSKAIAKNNLNKKWWFDKERKIYTAYKFDYKSFSPKYKGSPRFWRQPPKGLFLGFEFEMRFRSLGDKLQLSEEIKRDFRPCICEKDGSLDDGSPDGPSMEIITHPIHYKNLDIINLLLDRCKEYGAHIPNDDYGLHTTVNMAGVEFNAIQRFIFAINHPDLRTFFIRLAERDTSTNLSLGKKDWAQFESYDSPMDVSKHTFMARHSVKDHFYAAYLRPNLVSIELRFWKSTVDFSKITTIVAVIKEIYNWSLSNDEIIDLYRKLCV